EILTHRGVRDEDLVHVKAVVTRILILLLHHTDHGVGNVGEIDGVADCGPTGEQLLADIGADEGHMACLGEILVVVKTAFADLDGADLGKRRRGAGDGQRSRVIGAVDQNVALSEFGDNVFAVGRFLAYERQVDIVEAYAAAGTAASCLHAGASGEDDHHVTAEGAGDLRLTYPQALARGHHQHDRNDA